MGAPPPSADLTLGLTDSKDPVTVGEQFTYSLTIGNEGPDAAAEVEAAVVAAALARSEAASTRVVRPAAESFTAPSPPSPVARR